MITKDKLIEIIKTIFQEVVNNELQDKYSTIEIKEEPKNFLQVEIFDVPAEYSSNVDLIEKISSKVMSKLITTIQKELDNDFHKMYKVVSKILIIYTDPEEIKLQTGQIPTKITYTVTLPND